MTVFSLPRAAKGLNRKLSDFLNGKMQDPRSVIVTAAKGHVHELAAELEVSETRLYEILSKDNPYPKAKRLIRAIARLNPEGARHIKADLDAMFKAFEVQAPRPAFVVDLHREASEAIAAVLAGKTVAEQLRELRELVAEANRHIIKLESEE